MRSLLPAILGGLLVSLAPAGAAADTVLFTDGSYLSGAVENADLTVRTEGGPVKVAVGDLREIVLGPIGGDLIRSRTGQATAGIVEQPTYTVRLPSGQSISLARSQVSKIIFRPPEVALAKPALGAERLLVGDNFPRVPPIPRPRPACRFGTLTISRARSKRTGTPFRTRVLP